MNERTSRRSFLTQSVAGASAALAAPLFLNAQDKSGTRMPRVGSEAFTYECVHNWGELPNRHTYGGASHGVAVDSQGRIYITHHGGPGSLFVFDADGKFIKSMGKEHRVKDNGKGHGVDIRKEGSEEFLYLSPNDSSLWYTKMTLDGEVVWNRGRDQLHKDSGVLNKGVGYRPTNVSFRPDGGYYLGDGYGSFFIFEYDKNDKFVRVIGGKGKDDGKFATPHGQWLDDRDGTPKLVVADRANKRLQWFDLDGKHLRTQDGFLFPADIDTRGELMLVPDLHARISILDENNDVVAQLGDDEEWRAKALGNNFAMRRNPDQWRPGKFIHPHDACFDENGDIYCVEWVVTGRVTKLVKVS